MLVATLVLSDHNLETNSSVRPQMGGEGNSDIITQWNIIQQYRGVRHSRDESQKHAEQKKSFTKCVLTIFFT